MKKFIVTYFERKKITVEAEDFRQAATMIPVDCQFITVGEAEAPVEDLKCVHLHCDFCLSPLYGTVNGMVDKTFNYPSHLSNQVYIPFVDGVCCERCAVEKGIVSGV